MTRALKPCGTPAAYTRHRRRGEDICEACREAENRRCRKDPESGPWQPAECGTTGGYDRHRRVPERTCPPCREAWAAYMRDYTQTRKTRKDTP